ncbi:MAG: porin [Cytophagaceae bacterium]|nr:porin [Cytophagaceae bacterium]
MRRIALLALFVLTTSLFKAYGQDSTASGGLTISGYVDAYYTYNFNNPPFAPNDPTALPQPLGFTVQNPGRIFDIKHNQFSLGLAQTKFAYTKGKLTGVIDLTYGPNAELGNFGNVFGTMMSIKQAYMDYNFTDKLKFTIGQFGTHVGYELIDAPLNFNYSLSYLFGNGPFYHTGAKLAYTGEKFGVMAGVVNGWDSQFDFNKSKSIIAQLYVAPVEGWSVYINYVGGDEKNGASFPTIAVADSASTVSHIFDLTTTYQISDKLKIGLNAAYGTGNLLIDTVALAAATPEEKYLNASWYGAALYVNYSVSDNFGIGIRAEHFNDEDGVRYVTVSTGVPASYTEFTLTGDIRFNDGMFNIKPEFRIDMASKDVFRKYDSDGKLTGATDIQPTLGTAFIFKF